MPSAKQKSPTRPKTTLGTDQSAAGSPPAAQIDAQGGLLRIAAGLFRKTGLSRGTMDQVAEAAGLTKAALHRQFPTKTLLVQAIFNEVIRGFREADERPWYGYGGGVRGALDGARSFEDGYVLLIRDGLRQPGCQTFHDALRARAARRLVALLWLPNRPPPRAERPPLLALALDPMVSFTNEAMAHWVQHGDPSRDDLYLRWCGQMIRAWRYNAAEFLNLDSPEAEWPFESENSTPLA